MARHGLYAFVRHCGSADGAALRQKKTISPSFRRSGCLEPADRSIRLYVELCLHVCGPTRSWRWRGSVCPRGKFPDRRSVPGSEARLGALDFPTRPARRIPSRRNGERARSCQLWMAVGFLRRLPAGFVGGIAGEVGTRSCARLVRGFTPGRKSACGQSVLGGTSCAHGLLDHRHWSSLQLQQLYLCDVFARLPQPLSWPQFEPGQCSVRHSFRRVSELSGYYWADGLPTGFRIIAAAAV